MTDYDALAKRAVAAGIAGMMEGRYSVKGMDQHLLAPEFVRDGRVVLAAMEKCQGIFIEQIAELRWACRADKRYGSRTREWVDADSMAIAILTACLDALEAE